MKIDYEKPYLTSSKWDEAQELTEEIIHSKADHLKLCYKLAEFMESGALPPHMIASQTYLDLVVIVDLAWDSQAPVLITGETGTGKELLARTTHVLSNRSKGPFIAANCGGFTESLLEARLFGHTKGAVTGATDNQMGVVEAADGGTIFLDEIGDMPLSLQVHLLRVLQERVILPIGANTEREVDVRVIAATNRNLEAEVRAGRFRADLYYRLNPYRLHIPPLRERREEI